MNTRHFALVRCAMLALVALALLSPAPARSQASVSLTAAPAFEGNYSPGTWLPIDVRLSNTGPEREVTVAAALPESPFRNTQQVALPTGAEKRLTLYVAMEQEVTRLRLTVEADGTVLAEQELAVRPRADERLLGIVATVDPRLNLPRRQDLAAFPITTVNIPPADLPERAEGLSSLALLLLSGPPAEALGARERAALLGWVSAGGHLVLAGGPDAARTAAALPEALRPASIGAATTVPAEPLSALAGAEGPRPLPGVALTPAADARPIGDEATPAWVTRELGQGAVTQLAFDPGLPALAAWAGAPQFWDQLLQPPTLVDTALGLQPRADAIQEQIVAGALTYLPAISLPPANLIFGILAVYAVLVGPGLALLLRRYDRQALAWAAVPTFALATGAVVFGLALALRADDRLVNQLTLVEELGEGQARARTFLGVLTPQDQTFAAELSAPALIRPVRGASGTFGTVTGVRGDIAQEGSEAALTLESWQLQGVIAEGQVALPEIEAAITVGPDGPSVSIRNGGELPLRDVAAAFGERVIFFGDLRPGERLQAPWPNTSLDEIERGTAISFLVLRDALEAGRRAGQAADRGVLSREALINAALARGSSGAAEGPFILAWLDAAPLAIGLAAEGAARQEVTLLVLRPVVSGSGPVTLPQGWLRPALGSLDRVPCNGGLGVGVPAVPAPAAVALALPPGLQALRAEALTLTILSTGDWPNAGLRTELFDWERGAWAEVAFDGPGELAIPDAGPFLRGGALQLRFDGPIQSAQCLYIAAEVQGALP